MRARERMRPEVILNNIKNLLIEDVINYGDKQKCVLYYIEKEDGKHFCDYELLLEESSIKTDNLYKEKYMIVSSKDTLRIVTELENSKTSSDVITLYVNLWVNNITPYQLAQGIGISKQSISQMLNGQCKIPQKRKIQIAELLKFNVSEFDQQRTEFIFDETDV